MKKLDMNRLYDALNNIEVEGLVGDSKQRKEAIADAIAQIQTDGSTALVKRYIGVKNYSGFGDQREDHEYGMGPRHGSIVFSINRPRNCETVMGTNEIYLLECERDFKPFVVENKNNSSYTQSGTKEINLCETLVRIQKAEYILEEARAHIAKQEVDSHELLATNGSQG